MVFGVRASLLTLMLGLLAGCGLFGGLLGGIDGDSRTGSQPELAGVVKLMVKGADYVNPDTYGRPCPVVIRLYEVPDCQIINQYRFLDLYNKADHFLGSRLLYVRELPPLHPGQAVNLDIPLVKGGGCLVALVGYSQFREGTPLATLPITGSSTVQLNAEGLRVVLTKGGHR